MQNNGINESLFLNLKNGMENKGRNMLPITCKNCFYQKYKKKNGKKVPICKLPKGKFCPGDC